MTTLFCLYAFVLFLDEPKENAPDPIMGELLTWEDSTSTFSTEAYIVEVNNGVAVLKKKNGKIIKVPVERLSALSKRYIKSYLETVAARENKIKLSKIAIERIKGLTPSVIEESSAKYYVGSHGLDSFEMEFVFNNDFGAKLRGKYSSYLKTGDEKLVEFAVMISFERDKPKYFLINDTEANMRHAGFARDFDAGNKLFSYMQEVFNRYLGKDKEAAK